ncbi:MAG: hypothetical protein GWO20_06655 [Candidatus Korarchaeota archaeon]|nr:hypothetical protein [Candidatus Korarchaeota archaeon]NIW13503.1 hypothetical protein [Candidatus Thorarchaeota archaeon]NIW51601.1 hypothetical protein [Candidatus Korarchaeota archaeon]
MYVLLTFEELYSKVKGKKEIPTKIMLIGSVKSINGGSFTLCGVEQGGSELEIALDTHGIDKELSRGTTVRLLLETVQEEEAPRLVAESIEEVERFEPEVYHKILALERQIDRMLVKS